MHDVKYLKELIRAGMNKEGGIPVILKTSLRRYLSRLKGIQTAARVQTRCSKYALFLHLFLLLCNICELQYYSYWH